jgi:hypothetical protein
LVPDINNNLPTSRVLEILKGSDLFPTATFLPQAERYTDWWDRNGNCQMDAPEVRFSSNVFHQSPFSSRPLVVFPTLSSSRPVSRSFLASRIEMAWRVHAAGILFSSLSDD